MASQQIEERSERLEARVATLETELEQMKQILSGSHHKKEPWWLKVAAVEGLEVAVTVITYEEQVRGRLSFLSKTKTLDEQVMAYRDWSSLPQTIN